MNIELYIAKKLCDLEKSDLSIRLKRQLIKPSELNIKDAQKSYTISLPSTPVNDAIFRYSNVEESERKFTLYPDAELYVNGILIMEGKFRLTEITRDGYKGNLGVPAPLTAKDVFKEMKMNEIGEWKLSEDENMEWERQATISKLNEMENPSIMFPMVMHKLFNRSQLPYGSKRKDILDSEVWLRLEDMPPSINCMEAIRKTFSNAEYTLTGSAMSDERLNALYMSYKNPNDYKTDWDVKSGVKIVGDWQLHDSMSGLQKNSAENTNNNDFVSDIFEGENHSLKDEHTMDKDGWMYKTDNGFELIVPRDGVYKLSFHLAFHLEGGYNGTKHGKYWIDTGHLQKNGSPFEVQLVRKQNNKTLSEYKQVFGTNEGIAAQKVDTYQPCFVESDDFIAGYQMGKNSVLLAKLFEKTRVCTPLIALGTAVQSIGYNEKHIIKFKGGEPKTQIHPRPNNDAPETFVTGEINQLVWLKKGESIGMLDLSTVHRDSNHNKEPYIHQHNFTYTLIIQPFQKEEKWLKDQIITETNSTKKEESINWKTPDNYYTQELNITQFLPSETTVNDWLDNFCKAFNLKLTHVGDKNFSLDVKETKLQKNTSKIIDLDQKTNIRHGQNEPLNLPMEYQLGFTVKNSEEGYYESSDKELDEKGKESNKAIPNTGEDGGGKWKTQSQNTNVVKLNSNFSYCWYKDIEGVKLPVPVITEHEVWKNEASDYKEMMNKTYFNLPQRFWFKEGKETVSANMAGTTTKFALVSNNYKGNKPLQLDYKDEPNSIMRNYFMLLDNEQNYTTVECYLSPEEYVDLDNAYVKLNGDLYMVAEADGYDPMGQSKTKLKLIKKM